MRKLLLFVAGLMMTLTHAYAQSLSPSGFLRVPTAESPQGFTRGTDYVSWMADDSVVGSSHMIVGITPTLILRSIIGNDTTFSEDTSGNIIFKSTKGQKYTFMFNNSQIILSQSGFYLYSSPTAQNALSLWTSGAESDVGSFWIALAHGVPRTVSWRITKPFYIHTGGLSHRYGKYIVSYEYCSNILT